MSSPGKWLPPHKRAGFTGTGASMPKDFQTPRDAAASELKAIGFIEDTGGQLYYPEKHPHVHIGIGTDTFMAYSEGKQHLGGYGISMYQNKILQDGYTKGVNKMKESYGDNVADKLSQAVGILQLYNKAK
jgi:hypothetical protein